MPTILQPKAPVTWVLKVEMTEAERLAFEHFFYRMKDGVVATGLADHENSMVLGRCNEIYEALEGGTYSE